VLVSAGEDDMARHFHAFLYGTTLIAGLALFAGAAQAQSGASKATPNNPNQLAPA